MQLGPGGGGAQDRRESVGMGVLHRDRFMIQEPCLGSACLSSLISVFQPLYLTAPWCTILFNLAHPLSQLVTFYHFQSSLGILHPSLTTQHGHF